MWFEARAAAQAIQLRRRARSPQAMSTGESSPVTRRGSGGSSRSSGIRHDILRDPRIILPVFIFVRDGNISGLGYSEERHNNVFAGNGDPAAEGVQRRFRGAFVKDLKRVL